MPDNETTQRLLSSPAGLQWSHIGVRPHHGIALPLFSLHSRTSCGIGEFPDLLPLFEWCREIGMDTIQLLPLNDTGLDDSPYTALSAYALNPIHLGLSQLPFCAEDPMLQQEILKLQQLNNSQRVNYIQVRQGKDQFLSHYYQKYADRLIQETRFQAFKEENKYWLDDYACFKALKVALHWSPWELWPEKFQVPTDAPMDHLPDEVKKIADYHIFLQYLCFDQFTQVKQHAQHAGIFLKGDIPILINRESADVWRRRPLFDLQYAAGAPPDMYSAEGQKWGFPIYRWEAMREQHYRWWVERLRVAASFYHLFRIDHIVGFFRIWAIPLDRLPKEGFFIPQNRDIWIGHGETILRVMLNNTSMLPIGEDLGTVPPEARVCLRALGICGTKVMRWERRWNTDRGYIDPKEYPAESMTTVSTHDSETLELWWRNTPEEAQLYANTLGWTYTPQLSEEQRFAILRASHHSGSLFHINPLQEYLALIPGMTWDNPEDERINLPGIVIDTNWTYRFRPSVEEIVACSCLKEQMKNLLC